MNINSRANSLEYQVHQLQKKLAFYQNLIENQNDLVCRWLPDTTLTYVNNTYCKYFEKTREQLIGTRFMTFLPPETQDIVQNAIISLSRGEIENLQKEEMNIDSQGNPRWMTWNYHAISDNQGAIVEFQSVGRDITEHKQTEIALRNQLTFLQKIIHTTSEGFWLLNSEGKIIEVNQAYCKMSGYTRQELLQLSIPDIDIGESPADTAARIKRVVEKGTEFFQAQHRRKDGSVFDVEFSVTYLDMEGGQFICFCRDITEKKQTEAALRNKLVALTRPLDNTEEIEFEDLFDVEEIQQLQDEISSAIGVAAMIIRPDGTPLTRPSNFCHLCQNIIRKTEIGHQNCMKSDAFIGRYHIGGSIVQPCISGGLWDAGSNIMAGDKHIASWLIGQVRNEAQSEEKMRQYARLIGYDEAEFIKAFYEVPAMSEEQFRSLAKVIHTLSNQLSSIAYQNLQQARFITERKQAEAEKEKMQEQLYQSQKMETVGQLAGGMAHDFNNLLAIIIGHTESIMTKVPPSQDGYQELQEILQASQRSADIIMQILTFARKQIANPQLLDINNTITDLLKMLQRLIGEEIELTWQPGTDLSPVKIDPAQLNQVLVNLLVNSRDAIENTGQIDIETCRYLAAKTDHTQPKKLAPGEYVLLTIRDSGCGMNQETLSHLFEPFFTTKEMGKGTGLGLATTFGIIKQNNGYIFIDSEIEIGTTVKIFLPAYKDQPIPTPIEKINRAAIQSNNENILLVEDEEMLLNILANELTEENYNVIAANTPQEALQIAQQHPTTIHLLITDVMMPKMNGKELAQQIRHYQPNIKCLFMSGYTHDIISDHSLSHEGVYFIQKPFMMEDFAQKIHQALNA